MSSTSIDEEFLIFFKTRVKRVLSEETPEGFYLDDGDRIAIGVICEVARKNGTLPKDIETIAVDLGFINERKTC